MRRALAILLLAGLPACSSDSGDEADSSSADAADVEGDASDVDEDVADAQRDAADVAEDATVDASPDTAEDSTEDATDAAADTIPDVDLGDPSSAEDVRAAIEGYRESHSGNGGRDWDVNALTPDEVAADPEAQWLLALCSPDQRPVIPLLAWEYGGSDHQWISPEASALVYCVYTPVAESTEHWSYDADTDHVVADVYILFPDENPCRDETGADLVLACIGQASNIEILVDTASLHDGADVGLSLSEASTELLLLLPDGERVHLADD